MTRCRSRQEYSTIMHKAGKFANAVEFAMRALAYNPDYFTNDVGLR